jgi:large subunit ribosomal protein LX
LRQLLSEVKKFRIIGEIKKGKGKIPFSVAFNALKESDARQRLYSEMGSRHRARRFEISITKVQEEKEETVKA